VAAAAPPNVTVAPLPPVAGPIVPDILKVRVVAAKFKPVVILPPLTVTLRAAGVEGVTRMAGSNCIRSVAKPAKVKFPELLAVVVTFAAPLRLLLPRRHPLPADRPETL